MADELELCGCVAQETSGDHFCKVASGPGLGEEVLLLLASLATGRDLSTYYASGTG